MNLNEAVRREIGRLERTKTFKKETVIESEQGAVVRVAGKDAVMLASNNYLVRRTSTEKFTSTPMSTICKRSSKRIGRLFTVSASLQPTVYSVWKAIWHLSPP